MTLFDLPGPTPAADDVERTAAISADGLYRYELGRRWGSGEPVLWVMHNPSTADAHIDDLTIKKCIEFTKRLGAHALKVVNLYAYRTSSPAELERFNGDQEGPENADTLRRALAEAQIVIAAWGSSWRRMAAVLAVQRFAADAGADLYCLGTTKDGDPRHPGRLGYDSTLEPWPGVDMAKGGRR